MKPKIILGLSILAFAFMPAAKKINLEFNLEKGKTYHQTMELKSITKQTISGQEQTVTQSISNKMAMKVKSEGDNADTYTLTYENIQMEFAQGLNAQTFNSDTTQLETVDPMSRLFTAMTGQDFDATINRKGEVTDVSGLEELITKATAGMGAKGEALAPQISASFGEEGLIKTVEILTAIMPSEPVRIGDSWTKEQTTGSSLPIILNNTFTLTGIDNGTATIDVKGSVTVDPESATTTIQGMEATFFMDGEHTGSIQMDVKTGWVKSATFEDNIAGSITLSPNPQMPKGMTIPIEMKNTTTVSSE